MSDERLHQLIDAWRDNELSDNQAEELNQILRNSDDTSRRESSVAPQFTVRLADVGFRDCRRSNCRSGNPVVESGFPVGTCRDIGVQ